MSSVETRIDGSTLIVRIPMPFQRRGGRKRIVAPDGSDIVPTSKPQPDSTLVKALARAWRWQRQLENGRYRAIRELARAERMNHAHVVRVLKLTLLAPDLVEAILDGRQPSGLTAQELMREVPMGWVEQRLLVPARVAGI
jgi:hypothetical protein